MPRLNWIVIILLIATLAVSACQRATPTPEPEVTEETIAAPTEDALPTNVPIPTATVNTAATDSFPTPSGPTTEGLTPEESLAASFVDATYTGYRCVIAEVGCACEEPVIEVTNFEFDVENQRMRYRFMGESGYGSTWEMTRLGPNHWGYTIPVRFEGTGVTGALVVLLTFTEDGIIRNDAGDIDGTFVTCPDVHYRRVEE